jgi:hypothetical protein
MITPRRASRLALVLAVAAFAAACPGSEPDNPPRLWLALDGSQTMVRLVPYEPEPF